MHEYIFICVVYSLSLKNFAEGNFFCARNADCQDQNSECVANICQCTKGLILNNDDSKCVAVALGPDYKCKYNIQCSYWIVGPAMCKSGTCACQDGYRYSHDKCIEAIQFKKACNNNDECYNDIDHKAMVCEENKCVCSKNYYERAGVDCRPKAKVNDVCVINMDCPRNSICTEGICILNMPIEAQIEINVSPKTKSFQISNFNLIYEFDQICNTTEDCKQIANSFCVNKFNKCICNPYHTYDSITAACIPSLHEQCQNKCVKYATCNAKTNKCECNKYYINGDLNEKCYKPTRNIGDGCIHDKNCKTFGKNSICVEFQCQCAASYKFREDVMLCSAAKTINSCTTNEDCKYKPNYFCNKNEICECKEQYHESEDSCLPNIGTDCENNCDGKHVICGKRGKCECESGYVASGIIECTEELQNINDTCENIEQCKSLLGLGGICNGSRCQCKFGYTLHNETMTCLQNKYLGDLCRTVSDCRVVMNSKFVQCRNSVCACEYGYKIGQGGDDCIPTGAGSSFHISSSTIIPNLIYIVISTYLHFQ